MGFVSGKKTFHKDLKMQQTLRKWEYVLLTKNCKPLEGKWEINILDLFHKKGNLTGIHYEMIVRLYRLITLFWCN